MARDGVKVNVVNVQAITNQTMHTILVGEPWNFTNGELENQIDGHILKVIDRKTLLFKSTGHLSFGDYQSDYLILSPRYSGESFSDPVDLPITVNGALLLNIKDINDISDLTNAILKFVVIGSLDKL